jgi:hypothetical protein
MDTSHIFMLLASDQVNVALVVGGGVEFLFFCDYFDDCWPIFFLRNKDACQRAREAAVVSEEEGDSHRGHVAADETDGKGGQLAPARCGW